MWDSRGIVCRPASSITAAGTSWVVGRRASIPGMTGMAYRVPLWNDDRHAGLPTDTVIGKHLHLLVLNWFTNGHQNGSK